ncbi:MAG: hypothetical protein ACLUKN_06040 [Bacilli bacterium]
MEYTTILFASTTESTLPSSLKVTLLPYMSPAEIIDPVTALLPNVADVMP